MVCKVWRPQGATCYVITDLQVGVSLLQQLSEVQGHAPGRGLQLLWVEVAGLQPLEVHHTVLAVGQLGEPGRENQGGRTREGEPERENQRGRTRVRTREPERENQS